MMKWRSTTISGQRGESEETTYSPYRPKERRSVHTLKTESDGIVSFCPYGKLKRGVPRLNMVFIHRNNDDVLSLLKLEGEPEETGDVKRSKDDSSSFSDLRIYQRWLRRHLPRTTPGPPDHRVEGCSGWPWSRVGLLPLTSPDPRVNPKRPDSPPPDVKRTSQTDLISSIINFRIPKITTTTKNKKERSNGERTGVLMSFVRWEFRQLQGWVFTKVQRPKTSKIRSYIFLFNFFASLFSLCVVTQQGVRVPGTDWTEERDGKS